MSIDVIAFVIGMVAFAGDFLWGAWEQWQVGARANRKAQQVKEANQKALYQLTATYARGMAGIFFFVALFVLFWPVLTVLNQVMALPETDGFRHLITGLVVCLALVAIVARHLWWRVVRQAAQDDDENGLDEPVEEHSDE